MELELQNFILKTKKKLTNKIAQLETEKFEMESKILKMEIKIKELKEQLKDEEFIKQEAQKSLDRKKAKAKEKEKEKNSSLLNKNF